MNILQKNLSITNLLPEYIREIKIELRLETDDIPTAITFLNINQENLLSEQTIQFLRKSSEFLCVEGYVCMKSNDYLLMNWQKYKADKNNYKKDFTTSYAFDVCLENLDKIRQISIDDIVIQTKDEHEINTIWKTVNGKIIKHLLMEEAQFMFDLNTSSSPFLETLIERLRNQRNKAKKMTIKYQVHFFLIEEIYLFIKDTPEFRALDTKFSISVPKWSEKSRQLLIDYSFTNNITRNANQKLDLNQVFQVQPK